VRAYHGGSLPQRCNRFWRRFQRSTDLTAVALDHVQASWRRVASCPALWTRTAASRTRSPTSRACEPSCLKSGRCDIEIVAPVAVTSKLSASTDGHDVCKPPRAAVPRRPRRQQHCLSSITAFTQVCEGRRPAHHREAKGGGPHPQCGGGAPQLPLLLALRHAAHLPGALPAIEHQS